MRCKGASWIEKFSKKTGDHEQAMVEYSWLLKHSLEYSPFNIKRTSKQNEQHLNYYLHQRLNQYKPIQYILGNTPFCNLNITLRPPILIPRYSIFNLRL